ncbi:competence type IV pilus minor pilin ComGG [Bacillus massiliigorillae]|uniref:competence type IV pilus minor pilin ComGG n=1 Tax=Bacillus massiliigorillae TaxID=1243664 RepID=UPI0005A6E3DF|nr:competence type IV pilus minor pilin ComGG [Bacillus massiliigorillae]
MLIIMLIILGVESFVTEKRFSKEVSSKLMVDHLLFLAKNDANDYLHNELKIGEDGILFYENGDVYYRIEMKTKEEMKVLLYASSRKGGKAEASYTFNLKEGKVSKWFEI